MKKKVKVLEKEGVVIVTLSDGHGKTYKGVSRCNDDVFDSKFGENLATLRAWKKVHQSYKNELNETKLLYKENVKFYATLFEEYSDKVNKKLRKINELDEKINIILNTLKK